MAGIPILGIVGFPTWESREKHHLGVAPIVATLALARDQGKGVARLRAYK